MSKCKIVLVGIVFLVVLAAALVYWFYQMRVIQIEQDIKKIESQY